MNPAEQGHRGFIGLGLTLLIVTSLLLIGTPFLSLPMTESRLQTRASSEVESLALAEAGAELAFWEFKYNGGAFSGNGWNPSTDLWCSGQCVQRTMTLVVPPDNITTGTATIVVKDVEKNTSSARSTGQAQGSTVLAQVVVTMAVQRAPSDFQQPIRAQTRIQTLNQFLIDSYDSCHGTYGAFLSSNYYHGYNYNQSTSNGLYPDTRQAHIQTNGIGTVSPAAIKLATSSNFGDLYGTATIGPGGNINTAITKGTNVNLWGVPQKQAASTALTLTPKIFGVSPGATTMTACGSSSSPATVTPGPLGVLQTGNVTGCYINVNGPGDINLQTINIDNNATVTFTGTGKINVYVSKYVLLGDNVTLNLNPGTSVTFYVKGDATQGYAFLARTYFSANANSTGKNPSNLTLIVDNYPVTIRQGNSTTASTAYMGIYAPQSDVLIDSNTHFYGAIVGNVVTVNGATNSGVHYDEAMKNGGVCGGGGGGGSGPSTSATVQSWTRSY